VVVSTLPLDLALQAGGGLRRGLGAAGKRGHALADSQVEPFHEGGLQPSTPAQGAQGVLKCTAGAAAHTIADADEVAVPVTLVQLAVEEPGIDLPATTARRGDPGSEMCRE